MSGVRCWSSSSTGGLASIWKQWWTKSQQLKWRLRVISRSMCCAKNEPAAGTVPLGGQVVEFFLAVMSDASCQDLQAISVISGGGETECIHGSVRCLAAKVTGRGCHLPLDPLHVQISKIQTPLEGQRILWKPAVSRCTGRRKHSRKRKTICGRFRADSSRWRYARRRRTKDMLLWLFRMVLALGAMQTHQAPTTSKDMTHQQLQNVSVEGCGSAVFDSVGCR